MKRALLLLAAWLGSEGMLHLEAAISVGPTGAGPITFDTAPEVSEFATAVLLGSGSTFSDVASLDARVATLDLAPMTGASGLVELPTTSTEPPTLFAGGFRHHTVRNALVSRPTTSGTNAANLLLATFQNNSGGDRALFVLSYDFDVQSPVSLELPGFRVYFSLTGEAGSWQLLPEPSGTEVPGQAAAIVNLGSWPQGSLLYLLWVDDNADGGTDPSYTIDNFSIYFCLGPLFVVQQPAGTNIVQGLTAQMTAKGESCDGAPASYYRWFKAGVGPIDPLINPSAATPTLVITNVQFSDTGDYFAFIADYTSGSSSDVAHIEVIPDTEPPVFLSASVSPSDLITFNLTLDEPLCIDSDPTTGCGSDARLASNWQIINASNPSEDLVVVQVTINGTNVVFTTLQPRTPHQIYRIQPNPSGGGISDRYHNLAPEGTFATALPALGFRQGASGYFGTQDTELHSNASAATPLGNNPVMTVDGDNAGIAQGLIRFDDIVGTGPSQIPPGATVVSAALSLNVIDPGSAVNLHRMMVDWNQSTATWDSLQNGVQSDGVESRAAAEAVFTGQSTMPVDVAASVQDWVAGDPTFGWALLPTGVDGIGFTSSESANPPYLFVVYDPSSASTCQTNIIEQPAPYTLVLEGQPFTLWVALAPTGLRPLFQWMKDGVDVPGANAPSYSVATASPCRGVYGDVGTYRVRLTCGPVTVLSEAATVDSFEDRVLPRLTSAFVRDGGTQIELTFSKLMDANEALDESHYIFDPPLEVTSITLSNLAVVLNTAPRQLGVVYSLQVSNLTDNRGCPNFISPNPILLTLTSASVLSPWTATWRYYTNSLDETLATTPWFEADYDDSTWFTGEGLFGFDDSTSTLALLPAPIATPLLPNSNLADPSLITSYFRRRVTLPELAPGTSYVLSHLVDDGAIFYLDGAEIGRFNMTNSPPITYLQRAAGTSTEGVIHSFIFDATPGEHTLAAEVHQAGLLGSSDVLFGVAVRMVAHPPRLDIDLSITGAPTVRWTADSSWELMGSHDVSGDYTRMAGFLFGEWSPTSSTATNRSFFQLRYNGRP
jgi:hypothetical protein